MPDAMRLVVVTAPPMTATRRMGAFASGEATW
jgi:hypothetical protein